MIGGVHTNLAFAVRLCFVAAGVLICYQFEWTELRFLTSEVALQFAAWRGFPTDRLGVDLIVWNGELHQFTVSCTFADVFCGAIPLIWITRLGIVRNIANISGWGFGLLIFNLLRRCMTDFLYGLGVPWLVLDQSVAAVAYLLCWICLTRWRELHVRAGQVKLSSAGVGRGAVPI